LNQDCCLVLHLLLLIRGGRAGPEDDAFPNLTTEYTRFDFLAMKGVFELLIATPEGYREGIMRANVFNPDPLEVTRTADRPP
jgi:hypothetical protein